MASGVPLAESLITATLFLYYKKGDAKVFERLASLLQSECGLSASDALNKTLKAQDDYAGDVGIAKTTFDVLAKYAETPAIRAALLNVKIPDSLDPRFARDDFFTSRQNWQIQSPCVDVLHVLLTTVRAFCMEYDVQYWFILAVHDSVFFAVREGQENIFELILQRAHQIVKQMTYQEAAKHAVEMNPLSRIDPSKVVCPESQFWFSEVNRGQTVAEVI